MNVTVRTAADPAMPTCLRRDGGAGDVARAAAGAAAGEFTMGRGWKEFIIVVVVVVLAQDEGWKDKARCQKVMGWKQMLLASTYETS